MADEVPTPIARMTTLVRMFMAFTPRGSPVCHGIVPQFERRARGPCGIIDASRRSSCRSLSVRTSCCCVCRC